MLKGEGHIVGKVVEYRSPPRMEYMPGRLIVRMSEGAVGPHVGAPTVKFTVAQARSLPEEVSRPLEYLRKNAGLRRVEPLFSTRRDQVQQSRVAAPARDALAVISSVTDSANEDLRGFNVLEVDPKKVDADLSGVEAAPIGVVDTGVDQTHPSLAGVVGEYHHAGTSAADVLGHGTHVAGIIAASAKDTGGVTGVVRSRLIVWKVFDDEPAEDGQFYVNGDVYLRALPEARRAGAAVLNVSLGGTRSSRTEELLFGVLEREGITVVAAMGNEYADGNPTEYPAAYPGVLAVGAVDERLGRSSFSNTGGHIGLVAPGSNILSTLPMKASGYRAETEYAAWSGTSMATPPCGRRRRLGAGQEPDVGSDRN